MMDKFRKALSDIIEAFEMAAVYAPDPTTQKNMSVQARDWRNYRDAVTKSEGGK